jgi:hypothetical protein
MLLPWWLVFLVERVRVGPLFEQELFAQSICNRRMWMRNLVLLTAALAIGFVGITNQAEGGPKTKAVMKKCMKGGLCKKVVMGQGTADDKAALLAAFTAMAAEKAPKGDAESWKTKTTALVKAAQLAVDGDAGAGAALKSAANCAACHKVHKPK